MRDLLRQHGEGKYEAREIQIAKPSDLESDTLPLRHSPVASCSGLVNKALDIERLELGGNTRLQPESGNAKYATCA